MKNIILVATLLINTFTFAQVGIGTLNPQGIFNIDGAKDNAASGVPTAAQQANDFVVMSDAKVGIGTTAPTAKLEVLFSGAGAYATVAKFLAPDNGTIGNATQMNFGVSSTTGNSSEWRFVYQGDNNANNRVDFGMNNIVAPMITYLKSGNVGLGNTNPLQRLDVNGTALLRAGNGSGAYTSNQLLFSWSGQNTYQHGIKTRHSASTAADNAIDFFMWNQGIDNADVAGTKHVMSLLGNGNAGIGVRTPLSTLHVNSTLAATSAINSDAEVLRLSRPITPGVKWDHIAKFNLGSYSSTAGVNAKTRMDLSLNDVDTASTTQAMTWLGNGNVGIGTTAPTSKLEVMASSPTTDIASFYTTAMNNSFGTVSIGNGTGAWTKLAAGNSAFQIRNYTSDVSYVHVNVSNGNVGIGTTTPTNKLHVAGNALFIPRTTNDGVSGESISVEIYGKLPTGTATSVGGIKMGWYNSYGGIDVLRGGGGFGVGLAFNVSPDVAGGTTYEAMRIMLNGNVGIGNTNPGQKLDVTGNIKFSGALMPNNNSGTAGQLLASTGAGTAPTWVNASTYSESGASDEYTATAGQTSFTLTGVPKGKVLFFRNGARLPNSAFSVSGSTVTYVPANNGSTALGTLVSGDLIQIDYVK